MTSNTADDDHLLDEEIFVPETPMDSLNTFSQKLVRRLGIRSVVRNVDATTPINNSKLKSPVCMYATVHVCVIVCVCVLVHIRKLYPPGYSHEHKPETFMNTYGTAQRQLESHGQTTPMVWNLYPRMWVH